MFRFVFDPVMVRLAEHSKVGRLEHRAAGADRNEVMHFETTVTGFVGELAAVAVTCAHGGPEFLPSVGLVPLA